MDEMQKPPRVVGPVGATLMSVNGMIGAGIFALPALLYAEAYRSEVQIAISDAQAMNETTIKRLLPQLETMTVSADLSGE